jgi:hypothetical protein
MPKLRLLLSAWALALLACALPGVARADAGIVPLAPRPHERVQTATPAIIAALPTDTGRVLGRGDVTLFLDGRDRSDAISLEDGRVRYVPDAPLASGEHAVEVDVTDASGGRLSYRWTFTVTGANATESYDSGVTPMQALPGDISSEPSPSYAAPYATSGFSSFYAMNPAPFYWGEGIRFVFVGVPGGYGFVTFGGIPGFFNLIPFGFNTYYVLVPVPIGFAVPNPFIACHFFPPSGTPVVVPYPRHLAIVGRRKPQSPPPLRSIASMRLVDVPPTHHSLPPAYLRRPVLPAPRMRSVPRIAPPVPGPRFSVIRWVMRPNATRARVGHGGL